MHLHPCPCRPTHPACALLPAVPREAGPAGTSSRSRSWVAGWAHPRCTRVCQVPTCPAAGTEMPSPLLRCGDLLFMPGAALCQCHLHGAGTGDLGAHRASSCTAGHGKHRSCWAHSASRHPSQLQICARSPIPITQLRLPAPALVPALCPSARRRRSALPAACCPQRHLLTVIESSLGHFFPISQTHRALRP